MGVDPDEFQLDGLVRDMGEVEQLIDQADEALDIPTDEGQGGSVEERRQFGLVGPGESIVTHLEQVDH